MYRGRNLPIKGWYIYGDFCTGIIWRIRRGSDGRMHRVQLQDTSLSISSFGEGVTGEVYVADLNGDVYRLVRS